MGCASSNPLIESGKHLVESAKESAVEFAHKGENAIHDAGETAKHGITTGATQVKTAVESAIEGVGNHLGSSVNKIGDTFKSKHEEAEEALSNTVDDASKASEHMMEVVSEAETVLASEVDTVIEDIHDTAETGTDLAFDKIDTVKSNILEEARELHKAVDETLEIEDIEDVESSNENVIEKTTESVTTVFTSPEKEVKE
ncbi:hypothetical protein FQR65_LT14615 [Abscondita terminalis]|nr:hypothetical protein FQR65_LT14615 [Abscondita terminalis]